MADTAGCFLSQQIGDGTYIFIGENIVGAFAEIVQQIKIKIFHITAGKLFFKNFLRAAALLKLVGGELVGQIIAVPGIFFQGLAHKFFGFAAVVHIGGVEIIDAFTNQIVEDGLCLCFVDFSIQSGKTHIAHTKAGEFFAAKLFILHVITS